MEDNKTHTITEKIKDRAGRLISYLTELERIKLKVVRNIDDYQNVLWLSDIPKNSEYCFTRAWGENEEYDEDIWIEIKKYKEPVLEGITKICKPWVNWETLKNTNDIPELLKEIAIQEEIENPDFDPDDTDSEKYITINKTIYLEDYQEVLSEWEHFVETKWLAWVELYQKWLEVQKVYAKLFSIYQEQQKLGEQYELVLGLGLLSWRTPAGLIIKRHLITAKALLDFDARLGKFTLIPAVDGVDMEPEFDMLDIENYPSHLKMSIIDGLKSANDDPWDYSSIEPLLKTIINSIADRGQGEYFDSLDRQKSISDKPAVYYAPALILRKRSIRGIIQALQTIKEQIESGGEIPSQFFDLLEISDSQTEGPEFKEGLLRVLPEEIHFPKPYNEEQFDIVNKLQSRKGVLVQGPPGTGKSHTIANIICHYLAKGNRVLVTAKTPRALKVLYNQMPKQIRPLCVSLLGRGLEEKNSLEESVGNILSKQNSWNRSSVQQKKITLDNRIKELYSERAKVINRIKAIRESETTEHNILEGKYYGKSATITRRLKEEEKKYQWFQDKISIDQEMPVTKGEIQKLLKNINLLKPEIEVEFKKYIPDPKKDLIKQDEFEKLVNNYNRAEENINHADKLINSKNGKILIERNENELNKIIKSLEDILATRNKIDKRQIFWTNGAVFDVLTGNNILWEDFLNTLTERMKGQKSCAQLLEGIDIKIPKEANLMTLIRDAKVIKKHFEEGGKDRYWFLKSKDIKNCRYIVDDISINSEKCGNLEKVDSLISYLELKDTINSCWDLWVGRLERTTDPLLLQISKLEDMNNLLKEVIQLKDLLKKLKSSLNCAKELKNEISWHDNNELSELKSVCQAMILKKDFDEAKTKLEQYIEKIELLTTMPNPHPVTIGLLKSVQEKDVKSYAELLEKINELLETTKKVEQTRDVYDRLKNCAPIITKELLEHNNGVVSQFKDIEDAWDWARANSWLNDFLNKEDLPSLERHLIQTNNELNNSVAELSACLAWDYCFERMSETHRRHLVAWQEAFKKASRKYSKYKNRFMKDAQRQLSKCKDAIPAWVMPLHRVYETIEPKPKMFDIIVVDEASQCGPEGLPLSYLGKQLLIVGDDKQISPEAVGVDREQIFRLREEYLSDFEHADSFAIDSSIFSHGRLRFGAPIVLREHFRCMPEIIRFSNHLCYQQTPLIPLRQYPPNRLEPLKSVFVEEGFREGKNNRAINQPEAERLVNQIIKCCNDPKYDGKTMGVITLQGNSQAPLIENMLLAGIGSEEMSKRNLICGDPYSFQGDERDIVFLSMVAAPNMRIGALIRETDERRFNVAASRAKDQLWLFYSVTTNDLSQTDLRKRLIEFFVSPAESLINTSIDLEDLQLKAYKSNRQIEKAPEPFDSWFEVDVYLQIVSKGFSVIPQFKVGEKRIDLVIDGAKIRLAVECYGEYWHGLEEYESDSRRQRILERCGWNFFIIREAEFYANQEKTIERLCEKLNQMGIYSVDDPRYGASVEPKEQKEIVVDSDYQEREPTTYPKILEEESEENSHVINESSLMSGLSEQSNEVKAIKEKPSRVDSLAKLPKLSKSQIRLYKKVYKHYIKYSDIKKVARRVSLTSKKVQEILETGNKIKLFKYPIEDNRLFTLDKEGKIKKEPTNINSMPPKNIVLKETIENNNNLFLNTEKQLNNKDKGNNKDTVFFKVEEEFKKDDPLSLYLKEIEEKEILNETEEKKLFKKYKNGNQRVKDEIILSNSLLVEKIAKKYTGQDISFLDLIQVASSGLEKAVENFNYNSGYRFSTYATWQIEQAINRAVVEQKHNRAIQIPAFTMEIIIKIALFSNNLAEELGREPTIEEIIDKMELPWERIKEIMKTAQQLILFESSIEKEKDILFGNFIEDKDSQIQPNIDSHTLLVEEFNKSLKTLTYREKRILELRFGLTDGKPLALEEVAREFGINEKRTLKIEEIAIRKLRHPSRGRLVDRLFRLIMERLYVINTVMPGIIQVKG